MEIGCKMVNIVQILCIHVCKWKIIHAETITETRRD
jgi:hypothetical protein